MVIHFKDLRKCGLDGLSSKACMAEWQSHNELCRSNPINALSATRYRTPAEEREESSLICWTPHAGQRSACQGQGDAEGFDATTGCHPKQGTLKPTLSRSLRNLANATIMLESRTSF